MSTAGATEEALEKSGNNTALDSVRRLEEALAERRGVEESAAARVAVAREEADHIVRAAREEAQRDAAEHRRATLDRADREAGYVLDEAKAEAARLRTLAEDDRAAAAREVVELVLPGRGA